MIPNNPLDEPSLQGEEKIKEMWDHFYPDYDMWFDNSGYGIGWLTFCKKGLKYPNENRQHIHWFEFCVQHFADKIFKKLSFDLTICKLELQPWYKEDEEMFSEFEERICEVFDWTDNNGYIWWVYNTKNPDLFFYKGKYYQYGEGGHRKSLLCDLLEVDITNYFSPFKLENYLLDFGEAILINKTNPIDYLYEKFKKLK